MSWNFTLPQPYPRPRMAVFPMNRSVGNRVLSAAQPKIDAPMIMYGSSLLANWETSPCSRQIHAHRRGSIWGRADTTTEWPGGATSAFRSWLLGWLWWLFLGVDCS